ncbi:MAG: type II toxin-antitoxin system VapC family toxin [Rubrobacteraceae bacterium]
MRHLLDTNVVSELIAREPDPRVVQWVDDLDPHGVYLSVVTVGELQKGVEKLPDSRRKRDLREWLEGDLLVRFDGRILIFDVGAMLAWGAMMGRLERVGMPLPAMDSIIAALAIHHDCTLATRNEADFEGTGVRVANPWGQDA